MIEDMINSENSMNTTESTNKHIQYFEAMVAKKDTQNDDFNNVLHSSSSE